MRHLIRLPWLAKVFLLLASFVLIIPVQGSTPSETRDVLQEWVKVKSLISEETEEWASESVMLTDTIDLLREEKDVLTKQIKLRKESAQDTADERTKLSLKKEALETEAAFLSDVLNEYEIELASWITNLPVMLQEELSPLIKRLPKEGKDSTSLGLGRRLQAVVGILSQVDKFNSSITYRKELREGVETRETDTLYFGIGYAVYSDAEGTVAGFGRPSESGWIWENAPESSENIQKLIAVYKNETPATYVSIPVEID